MQSQYAVSIFDAENMRYVCMFVTQDISNYEYELNKYLKQGYVKVDDTVYSNEYITRTVTRLRKE